MFLTDEEIHFLTGYKKPALQRKQLRLQGVSFLEDAFGNPRVLKETVQSLLNPKTSTPRKTRPDFGALKKDAA